MEMEESCRGKFPIEIHFSSDGLVEGEAGALRVALEVGEVRPQVGHVARPLVKRPQRVGLVRRVLNEK